MVVSPMKWPRKPKKLVRVLYLWSLKAFLTGTAAKNSMANHNLEKVKKSTSGRVSMTDIDQDIAQSIKKEVRSISESQRLIQLANLLQFDQRHGHTCAFITMVQ